ncbi:MAG: glycosyl hydrolase [Cyclobacteriaceae bacterium]|nr:glycosyl hydrolase [Cyclobacteriaceae bacterium]MDH4295582.1 glycosyl hydrolase [Cyclobacteriaceae bacterium]MDH5249322.1 glycosyl hydrolase [Cyclobacteriaceae bacterium]
MIKRLAILVSLCFCTAGARAQFRNIKLDEASSGNRVAEPSIAINQKDTRNIVAASILDNIYYTFDGGQSWESTKLSSPYGVYGDPVLISDAKGTIYAFHLSDPTGEGWRNEKSLDYIVCHISKDGGKTWEEGSPIGYNPPKDQDKPWATIDSKGDVLVTWTQFDKYNSPDSSCQSNILLSTSSNGKKWTKPVKISQMPGNCLDDDNTTEGAVPAATADGKVFVAWAGRNKIFLDRSFDGGGMWLTNDITVTDQPGGWDFEIPGHDRCNGMPVLMVDKSKGVYRGCLYIAWADQRNGESNTDVWFMRSNNYGDNWSSPMKMGKDSTQKHQYLPWMAVDQVTGYIYIVYYDRGNYEDNQTDVYLAYSVDSGINFKNVKISETPFIPVETSFFGDYTNISAHDGIITPVWTRMDDGKTSVWTAVIKQDELIPPVEPKGKKKR